MGSSLTKLQGGKAELVLRKMARDESQDLCPDPVGNGRWHGEGITEVGLG